VTLEEIGKYVVDYVEDTGECLFCYRTVDGEEKTHHPMCPVGLYVAGAAADPPSKST
jgi:hypothetical protein